MAPNAMMATCAPNVTSANKEHASEQLQLSALHWTNATTSANATLSQDCARIQISRMTPPAMMEMVAQQAMFANSACALEQSPSSAYLWTNATTLASVTQKQDNAATL
jgi:hypothetical protein